MKTPNKDTQAAMMGLIAMAIKLNASDFHVFVDYSGHVCNNKGSVTVNVYEGGWEQNADHARWDECLDCDNPADVVVDLMDKLASLHTSYRAQKAAEKLEQEKAA